MPGEYRRSKKVFLSYSHEDEALRKELDPHLGVLRNEGIITPWWDHEIPPGAVWSKEIRRELDAADLILLLISQHFLTSPFCVGEEMHRALERHEAGTACVVPIMLGSCDWRNTLFAKAHIQGLPWGMRPVTDYPEDQRNTVWTEIAAGIRRAAERCPPRPEPHFWKVATISIALGSAVLFALLLLSGWDRSLKSFWLSFQLRVHTLHSHNPAPPPVPRKSSFKFYGVRQNNDGLLIRLEKLIINRFSIDTRVSVEPSNPTREERLSRIQQCLTGSTEQCDVAMIDIIWTNEAVLKPNLVDLRPFFEIELSKYDPRIVTHNTVDNNTPAGALMAMPWFQETGVLFYNRKFLKGHPPKTWDELEHLAAKIQEDQQQIDSEFIGFVWQGKPYEGLTCNALEWIASWGALDLKTGLPLFDHEGVLEALDRARKWVKGTLNPKRAAISLYADVKDYDEDQSLQALRNGKAAFMRGWTSAYARLGPEPEVKFGIAPLPHGNGHDSVGTIGGWHLAISKNSPNRLLAADFIRYLTSSEVQKWFAENSAHEPTRTDVALPEPLKFLKEENKIKRFLRPVKISGSNYTEVSKSMVQTKITRR